MQDTMVRNRTIRFHAGEPREGPLAWGQLAILRELEWLADESFTYNESAKVDVGPGTGLDEVLDVVRRMMEAHEGLRTTIGSPTATGEPRQQVHASGEIAVRVVEGTLATAGSPDARHNFDIAHEFPVRWTVFCRAGTPVELLCVISHSTIDGTALLVFKDKLRGLLAGEAEEAGEAGRAGQPEEPAWHPLDQVQWESTAGAAHSRAAVRRWLRLVDEAPQQMFNARYPSTGAQDFQCYEMRSVAGAVALQRVARRLGVSTSTVLVALTGVAVARLSGNRRVIFKMVVGNRREEHLQTYLAPLVQDGIIALDTEGSFATVVRRAWPASVLTYSRSRYHPRELHDALAGYAARRGHDGDPRVALNDARFNDSWHELPDPVDDAELWALRDRTGITHLFSQERVDVKFFVEVPQATDCLCVTLLTDGTYVPTGLVPQILRGMEELLVREATRADDADDAACVEPPFPVLARSPEWALVEGSWIRPDRLRSILVSIPGVAEAKLVDPSPVPSPAGLRCRLVVSDPFDLTEPAVRQSIVDACRGREDVLVPEVLEIVRPGGPA